MVLTEATKFLQDILSDRFFVQLFQRPYPEENIITVGIDLQIPIKETSNMTSFANLVMEAFNSTKIVKHIQSQHEQELSNKQAEIDELKEHIEVLKEFKVYYDMQFAMRHGKDNNDGED